MKKIIIFGATGNIGSYLVKYASEYFNDTEYEVIASGRRKTDVFEQFGVKYVDVDITNPVEFRKLPKDNVHAIIMLAAVIPSFLHGRI